jgi:DNA-binding transcriptional regulator YhcF (GntR family)
MTKTPETSVTATTEAARLLSRRQVGEMIGVHPGSIARYERLGQLKAVKINARVTRYLETEVRRFIAQAAVA